MKIEVFQSFKKVVVFEMSISHVKNLTFDIRTLYNIINCLKSCPKAKEAVIIQIKS